MVLAKKESGAGDSPKMHNGGSDPPTNNKGVKMKYEARFLTGVDFQNECPNLYRAAHTAMVDAGGVNFYPNTKSFEIPMEHFLEIKEYEIRYAKAIEIEPVAAIKWGAEGNCEQCRACEEIGDSTAMLKCETMIVLLGEMDMRQIYETISGLFDGDLSRKVYTTEKANG